MVWLIIFISLTFLIKILYSENVSFSNKDWVFSCNYYLLSPNIPGTRIAPGLF